MAKIVVSEFVSIDGVMEAPGGEPGYKHSGWVAEFQDTEQYTYKLDEVFAHEALLIGRKTYESFAAAWPSVEGDFGYRMNSMPKHVASTTLEKAGWNNTYILQGDAMEAVKKLKQQMLGDILVVGSRTLVNALRQHDLIDEYRLMVFPLILGSGMRLFADAQEAATLKLVDTHPLQNGAVVLTYQPVRTEA